MTEGYWIAAKPPLTRRCRAGHCFDQAGHGIAAAVLGEDQLAALEADPWLVVEATEFAPENPEPATPPGGGAPPPGVADAGLSETEHMLRAYLAGLKADGKGKPKVAEARTATGIAALSAAEVGAAWRALE